MQTHARAHTCMHACAHMRAHTCAHMHTPHTPHAHTLVHTHIFSTEIKLLELITFHFLYLNLKEVNNLCLGVVDSN